jgi:hypothetical protein
LQERKAKKIVPLRRKMEEVRARLHIHIEYSSIKRSHIVKIKSKKLCVVDSEDWGGDGFMFKGQIEAPAGLLDTGDDDSEYSSESTIEDDGFAKAGTDDDEEKVRFVDGDGHYAEGEETTTEDFRDTDNGAHTVMSEESDEEEKNEGQWGNDLNVSELRGEEVRTEEEEREYVLREGRKDEEVAERIGREMGGKRRKTFGGKVILYSEIAKKSIKIAEGDCKQKKKNVREGPRCRR